MSCKITVVIIAALALLICACESGPTGPSVPLKQLEGAPEVIKIGDREYTLETSLYRDFFGFCPPEGHPLYLITYVIGEGEEEFPWWLEPDRVWVVNGEEVWETLPVEEKSPGPANQLKRFARGGPKWKPYLYVDVIVRLVDPKGNSYLLRAADQQIRMSW